MTRPLLLLATEMNEGNIARLTQHFDLIPAFTDEDRFAAAHQHGAAIRGIIVRGAIPVPRALLDLLPGVGIICSSGVGYEGIDREAALARGITITHGRGANADSVADQAMALLLAVVRQVPHHDARVRAGQRRDLGRIVPQIARKRAGIIGLGDIGVRIARRCGGFDMDIRYHTRRPVAGAPWDRADSVMELANWADVLIAVVPGGPSTRHMINADVLGALGPAGYLVNVGRGSVVDTAALIRALETGTIAGAGLDVFEGEPDTPEGLRASPRVVLSPHIGGLSPESQMESNQMLIRNLLAHFAGQAVETPIPA